MKLNSHSSKSLPIVTRLAQQPITQENRLDLSVVLDPWTYFSLLLSYYESDTPASIEVVFAILEAEMSPLALAPAESDYLQLRLYAIDI